MFRLSRHVRHSVLALLVLSALFSTAASSEAALLLRLTSGVSSVTVEDTDADGVVLFTGSLDGFAVNITAGLSKPLIGPAAMDLSTVNVASATGGTLTIELTDTDFDHGIGGEGNFQWGWGGTVSGGSITGQAWKDLSNTEFGEGSITTGLLGPFTGMVFSSQGSVPHGLLTDPYSMTIRLVYAAGPGNFSSGDFQIQNVPEPAELFLFGLGLTALGLVARRRRQENQQAS